MDKTTDDTKSFETEERIITPLTKILGIKHPVMLAGMSVAAGPKLAAAVTNAGGIGVVGGVGWSPKMMRRNIEIIKKHLKDKNGAFGVDLLLPQVGGSARKTNYDYTKGKLPELVDIIIECKVTLFVSAVGTPPKWLVNKLHAAGIPIMSVIGAPKHVKKVLDAGVDIVCAQGGEAGGHTGDVATSVLLPAVVDLCRGRNSPLTGEPIVVVAAGGINDGRGLAMALSYGASGVWVGTRFVCATEAGAPKRHKDAILNAGFHDTIRTPIWTGRPLRCLKNEYNTRWETERADENRKLRAKGIIPAIWDFEQMRKKGEEMTGKQKQEAFPLFMGIVSGAINEVQPAAQIVNEMVVTAVNSIRRISAMVSKL